MNSTDIHICRIKFAILCSVLKHGSAYRKCNQDHHRIFESFRLCTQKQTSKCTIQVAHFVLKMLLVDIEYRVRVHGHWPCILYCPGAYSSSSSYFLIFSLRLVPQLHYNSTWSTGHNLLEFLAPVI